MLNYATALEELRLFNGYTKERAADILADQIKNVADGVAFVLGIAACFVAPGVANILLSYGMDMASAAYAEQVSGEVRAVVGTKLRSDNTWENVELPRLMGNSNVTKITIIDPKTGIETVIFER